MEHPPGDGGAYNCVSFEQQPPRWPKIGLFPGLPDNPAGHFQTNLQTFKQTFKLSNQLSNQPSNFQTNFQTFKPTFKARACVTRVVQRSCQAREHKKYILPPRTMSCCNSLTVMYMNLVLGVYSKALLQDSCSHQWPLGKFPHSQLCCRHLRPDPYNDSHCVAAPVRYDTRLSSSSTCFPLTGLRKASQGLYNEAGLTVLSDMPGFCKNETSEGSG